MVRSIPGFRKPQGLLFVASLDKLFVASGDDGMLRVYRGRTFELLDSIKLGLGPNRIAYDPQADVLYVEYGGAEAGKDYGEVAIIDPATDEPIIAIRVASYPAELLLTHSATACLSSLPSLVKYKSSTQRSALSSQVGQSAARGLETLHLMKLPSDCCSAHSSKDDRHEFDYGSES